LKFTQDTGTGANLGKTYRANEPEKRNAQKEREGKEKTEKRVAGVGSRSQIEEVWVKKLRKGRDQKICTTPKDS